MTPRQPSVRAVSIVPAALAQAVRSLFVDRQSEWSAAGTA
jgi:hypothetical protein